MPCVSIQNTAHKNTVTRTTNACFFQANLLIALRLALRSFYSFFFDNDFILFTLLRSCFSGKTSVFICLARSFQWCAATCVLATACILCVCVYILMSLPWKRLWEMYTHWCYSCMDIGHIVNELAQNEVFLEEDHPKNPKSHRFDRRRRSNSVHTDIIDIEPCL